MGYVRISWVDGRRGHVRSFRCFLLTHDPFKDESISVWTVYKITPKTFSLYSQQKKKKK